jgi:regulator of sigma E protease
MIDVLSSILAFIVAISVLVAVHEYGHFWVARRLGFKVLRYSIGFGKPLVKWRGKGPDFTEYWLSSIPLGGYVKLLDEREGPVPEAEAPRAFNRRPIPHRIAVLLAGPGFNFLFAILAYWAMFVSGVPGIKPIVGMVTDGTVAAESGLRTDDQILSVGGRETATWEGALIAILDELLADGRIDLVVRETGGNERRVELDVRGRESELTEPDALFTGLGFSPGPTMPADIARVDPDSPAERAGLRADDRVLAVSGAGVPRERIQSWQQWLELIRRHPGETVDLDVERDGSFVQLSMTIGVVEEDGERIGRIGAWRPTSLPPDLLERIQAEQRYGPIESLVRGAEKTWEMTALTVRMLARMFTGDVSYRNVSGPISIASYAGDSAAAGMTAFLSFLAIVSISLGIMNLLPVPLLDGGQIVYQLIELLKGSPLSERTMIMGQQLGIMLLIVLMSFVFYNDLTRMFG